MPQIPYQPIPTQRPGQPLDYQRVQATPDAFGAGVGRAAQQFGAQMERGADVINRAAEDFQKRQDTTDVDALYSNVFSPAFREMYQKYYSLQGKDAVDAMPTFIEQMQGLQRTTADSLPNDRQKHLFNSMSRRRVDMELDGMARYANTQNKVYKLETFNSTLDNLELQAADKHNDEQAFGATLGTMRFTVEKYAMDNGKPAEWVRDKIAERESSAAVSRLQRQIIDDPEAARKWYEANKSMVSPKARPLLEHQIKAAVLPLEIKQTADRIMGPDADLEIKQSLSGGAPFPAAGGDYMRYSAPDEATAAQMAEQLQSEGKQFAITVGPSTPQTPRETRAMLGNWVAAAEREYPNDPVKRDALIAQIKNRVSTLATIQKGVQDQAHSTLTKLMMQGAPPTDVSELTGTPEGRQAWAFISPESQRGFIAWLDKNQRKAEGTPSKVNAALMLDLGVKIHSGAITNANQLIPYLARGLTIDGKRSLEKELDERLTPDGRRLGDVRKNALDALLPRFDSSTLMIRDEKGKEDFLRFKEYALAKEAKLSAEGKDPYSIYNTTSKDYIGNDVAAFKRNLQQVMQDRIDAIGGSRSTAPSRERSGAIGGVNPGVVHNGFVFPSQEALDRYKAAGGK